MKTLKHLLYMFLLGALLAPAALAQNNDTERPTQKADPKARYSRVKYDAAAEVTVVGRLEEIQEFDCPVSNAMGSHFIIRSVDSTIVVHVAPVSFMKQNGI